MMKRKLRSSLLTVAAVLIASAMFASARQDFEKKVIEQFAITADGDVEVSNKYGNISVETWSENQVKFEVTITVDARDQEKANEIFERVNINFSNTSSLVRAATEISTAKNWKRWMGNNSDKFEISYRVWIPASVSVGLDNKYGDIALASIEGDCRIDLRYGNMSVDDIKGDVSLSMAYAKGSLGAGGKCDLDLKYSKLKCGALGDISANTKYSSFEAESAGVVQSNTSYDNYKIKAAESFSNVGKYDDFDFGSLESATINTSYTHIGIGELARKGDFSFRHGGIRIDKLKSGFTDVTLDGSYGGISITTEPSAQFNFDFEGRYGSVKYSNVEVYYDVKSNNTTAVKGFRGARDQGGMIKARTSYGSIKIY